MTDQHPITPPPELVQKWREAPGFSALSPCVMVTVTNTKLQDIAIQAAQWGADQELEACGEWLGTRTVGFPAELRAARRPNPLSLKEQALALLNHDPANQPFLSDKGIDIIRRALEQLPDHE